MPKLNLLILDAGIIIKLFELGLWDQICDSCDIHLSRIVALDEALFHSSDDGNPHGQPIVLQSYVDAGRVTLFEATPSTIRKFRNNFDANYREELDPGEAESLAYLFESSAPYRVSSSDAIVFKVLGNTMRTEQGISLEEILSETGYTKDLPWQYRKAFRDKYSTDGGTDMLQGRGKK